MALETKVAVTGVVADAHAAAWAAEAAAVGLGEATAEVAAAAVGEVEAVEAVVAVEATGVAAAAGERVVCTRCNQCSRLDDIYFPSDPLRTSTSWGTAGSVESLEAEKA
jgi:hypothetical protein